MNTDRPEDSLNDSQALTQEQVQQLASLAVDTEQELALAVQNQSNRAFNLGCALWVVPGIVVVVAAFLLSRANWVIAFFLAVLVALIAVAFALLSAYNTKQKAIERLYREVALPQIRKTLVEINLSRPAFESVALQTLPSDALLRQLLDNQHSQDEPKSDTAGVSETNE